MCTVPWVVWNVHGLVCNVFLWCVASWSKQGSLPERHGNSVADSKPCKPLKSVLRERSCIHGFLAERAKHHRLRAHLGSDLHT